MPKERIMITGSEGLIGQVLVNSWKDIYDVVELDIRARGDGMTKFTTDISSLESTRLAFNAAQPIDAVVHLAGKPEHTTPWEEVLQNNIIGTRNVYECIAEFGIKKVVLASTTHLQGGYDGYPQVAPSSYRQIKTTDQLPSDSYYGTSKVFAEALAGQFLNSHRIKTACLRIGSVTPDNQPRPLYRRVWLSHRDASQVFLSALGALKDNLVFGRYYATSDNDGNPFDINSTIRELGYHPQDRASL